VNEHAILEVDGLTVAYTSGDYVVRPLDGLSFAVDDGALALLLGPSGSGKTTLLSCLAGILTPTSGTARFAGRTITGLSGGALTAHRRSTVGVVFQAFNLVPALTATENVMAPLLAAGERRRVAEARAAALLEQVGLADRARHRPGDLSGGQQQRVAIARALVHDPPLVLADEPTAHLDYVQVEGVLRLLRELAAPGRAVLVSTHDERMLRLADQVVDLAPATTVPHGEPERLELHAGDVIFRQGTRGALVYNVEVGQVDVVRERPDGGEDVLSRFGAGDYFGEMGPMFDLPRSATARAASDAVVVGYPLERFRSQIGVEHLTDLINHGGVGRGVRAGAGGARPARARPLRADRG
jgi:putative ABC transport system ATP-binding protein